MTETSVPPVDRGPANSAQVGTALIDVGHLLTTHPDLTVLAVEVQHTARSAGPVTKIHLSTRGPGEVDAVLRAVTDPTFTHHSTAAGERRAWWSASLDGIPVIYTTPDPEPTFPSGALLVCGDCLPPARKFPVDADGVTEFFLHVHTDHPDTRAGEALATLDPDGTLVTERDLRRSEDVAQAFTERAEAN